MHFLRQLGGVVFNVVLFGVFLFVPAGTLDWWRAWLFLAVVLIASAATMFGVMGSREELLKERYGAPIQKNQPLADRIILPLLVITFVVAIVVIPIDVFHLHLLGGPGAFLSTIGIIAFAAGWSTITVALRANSFAAPVVKLQTEQSVTDFGIYAFVRHPMYSGGALLMIGMPLWFGSWAATIFAIVPITVLALRIVFEERLLRRELSGYDAYARRVRYRLVPFVW